jgi:uncharacterized membrane protein
MAILLFFYLLALVCWLGGMVVFSAIVAPAVFTTLSRHEAGNLVAAIFPRYYVLGYVCGAIALVLAIWLAAAHTHRAPWTIAAILLAAALALTAYAGVVVRPQVDAIRTVTEEANPDPARRAEFDRLHHLSVMLNGGAMLLETVALLLSAVGLTPRT